MKALALVLLGVLSPLVGILGLLGNITSVVVLNSSSVGMKTSFCRILTMLSIYDSILILCMTGTFGLKHLSSDYSDFILPYVAPYLLPICQIALSGSTWSTVSVAMERFISLVVPHYRLARGLNPLIFFILPVILLSVIFNIPHFFELYTCVKVNKANNNTYLSCCPTDLRLDPGYARDYIMIANFIGMVFIPIIILCILNGCIYNTIRRASRESVRLGIGTSIINARGKRDQKIAMLLITVVVVFLICNIPRIIVTTYEVLVFTANRTSGWPKWCQVLSDISHFLLIFNSSINVFIYCWKDDKFRLVLLRMLKIRVTLSPKDQENFTMDSNLGPKRTSEKNEEEAKEID